LRAGLPVATAALCASVLAAVGCRQESQGRPEGGSAGEAAVSTLMAARSEGAALPEVVDYVAHPVVEPGEASRGPTRIVSLAPSITEVCCALGLADRLVGRTQFCRYPPAVQRVEVIGALLDPNIERIVQLRPEMVLTTASSGLLRQRLERVGLPVRALPDSSLEDVFRAIRLLGGWTGRERTAERLCRALRGQMDALSEAARRLAGESPLRAVVVTGPLPVQPRSVWVAGPGSYVDSLVRLAGLSNAVAKAAAGRPWLELPVERICWLRPQVLVEVREPVQMPLRRQAVEAWRSLPGLAKVRVVTIKDPAFLVAGPRVNLMLATLIRAVYLGDDGDAG